MTDVILFDVNETLLDLNALHAPFADAFGSNEPLQAWFADLLHSSLVVTLVDSYADFGALARAALDRVAARSNVVLAPGDHDAILDTMRSLPPHPDVVPALTRLRDAGFRLATLTNSPPPVLEAQMASAGLTYFFEQLLSVHPTGRFKPHPAAYHYAARTLGMPPAKTRLVAAHDWDTAGALAAGLKAAYVARGPRPYHPAFPRPDITGPDLTAVADQLIQ